MVRSDLEVLVVKDLPDFNEDICQNRIIADTKLYHKDREVFFSYCRNNCDGHKYRCHKYDPVDTMSYVQGDEE